MSRKKKETPVPTLQDFARNATGPKQLKTLLAQFEAKGIVVPSYKDVILAKFLPRAVESRMNEYQIRCEYAKWMADACYVENGCVQDLCICEEKHRVDFGWPMAVAPARLPEVKPELPQPRLRLVASSAPTRPTRCERPGLRPIEERMADHARALKAHQAGKDIEWLIAPPAQKPKLQLVYSAP